MTELDIEIDWEEESPEEARDRALYITAAELRTIGIPVPENIPSVARVPRHSIRSEVVKNSIDKELRKMMLTFRVTFTEPFRWVEGSFVLEESFILESTS